MAADDVRREGVALFESRIAVLPVLKSTLANRGAPKRRGEVWAGDLFEGGSAEDLRTKESRWGVSGTRFLTLIGELKE